MKQLGARRQAGDTIVEVLIAITIVAVILVGAFYVANNSTQTVQDNQEHTQAQQALQSQVEALRAYLAPLTATTDIHTGTSYCMAGLTLTNQDGHACQVTVGGTTANPTFTSDGSDTYTFSIQWDSIKGGTAHEQFTYRAYPGS